MGMSQDSEGSQNLDREVCVKVAEEGDSRRSKGRKANTIMNRMWKS